MRYAIVKNDDRSFCFHLIVTEGIPGYWYHTTLLSTDNQRLFVFNYFKLYHGIINPYRF